MPDPLSKAQGDAVDRRIDALLRDAEAGGALALQAARQAAALASTRDPRRFRRALTLAAQLDPLDASPRIALARRYAEEGALDAARSEAAHVFKEAIDEAARTHASFILGELARATGDRAEARSRFETCAHISGSLLAREAGDAQAAHWHARALGRLAELDAEQGLPDKAYDGAEAALSILRALAQQGEPPMLSADIADAEMRLGALDLDAGEPVAARGHLGEAIGRYEALSITEPDEPHWRAVLSDCWALAAEAAFQRSSSTAARDAMDNALKLRVQLATKDPAERWALAATWRKRAALLEQLGDSKAAASSLVQARALAEQLYVENAGDADAARFYVHTLMEQGDLALRMSALEVAKEAASEARARAEPFAADANALPSWRADLASIWDRLGDIARAARAMGPAQDAYARAVELRRLVREAAPSAISARRGLASSLMRAGDAAFESGAVKSARAAFDECCAIRLLLAEAEPGEAAPARDLAVALERLGHAALADKDRNAARSAWRQELAIAERIYANDYDAEGLRFRAVIEVNLASLRDPEAEHYRRAALKRLDTLASEGKLGELEAKLRARLIG